VRIVLYNLNWCTTLARNGWVSRGTWYDGSLRLLRNVRIINPIVLPPNDMYVSNVAPFRTAFASYSLREVCSDWIDSFSPFSSSESRWNESFQSLDNIIICPRCWKRSTDTASVSLAIAPYQCTVSNGANSSYHRGTRAVPRLKLQCCSNMCFKSSSHTINHWELFVACRHS